MTVATTKVAISSSAWTAVYTSTADAVGVGVQIHANYPVRFATGTTSPTTNDDHTAIVIPPKDALGNPNIFEIKIDNADKLYARLAGGTSGNVTVVG